METSFRQYTTSIPIIEYGRYFPRKLMYSGVSLSLKIIKGRNRRIMVTKAMTAIKIAA